MSKNFDEELSITVENNLKNMVKDPNSLEF